MKMLPMSGAGPKSVRQAACLCLCIAVALITQATAQPNEELIIRNGLVVTVEGRYEADVRIRDGKIAEINPNLPSSVGVMEIDAAGMFLIPGGIDPHMHMRGETPTEEASRVSGSTTVDGTPISFPENYESGSRASLAGGVTTMGNFVSRQVDEDVGAFLDRNIALVENATIADVFLHVNIGSDPSWVTSETLSTMADRGFTSTKTFMRQPYFDIHAVGFIKSIYASGLAGILSMIHAEDGSIINELANRMVTEGRGGLHNYVASRPAVTEAVAVHRAAAIAETTGAPVYIVHLAAEDALREAAEAQRRGLPLYVETRPMYLHLTDELFLNPEPGIYAGSPPLRKKSDQDALWEGLANGTVHTIGTDHGGRTRESKIDPSFTVVNLREGVSNVQVVRPMLFSEGVLTNRISLETFVAVTSTNPAKLFGMYPRKGTIKVGSDADVVIWDPYLKRTIRDEDVLSNARWSVYAGTEVVGWPVTTIRRGEIVYQDGEVIGQPSTGEVIPQARWQRPNLQTSGSMVNAR